MKERVEELEHIRGLILRNYNIFLKITKETEKLGELLQVAGKEQNFTEWLSKTEVFRKMIRKDVIEFSSNTNKLSKFVSKIESKLYSIGEYELGFSLVHYLTKSKQYRYTMKSRTLVDKFTESRRFAEANQLKKDLKAMVFLMDAIEQLIVDFEKVMPIEKGALYTLGFEFTQSLHHTS